VIPNPRSSRPPPPGASHGPSPGEKDGLNDGQGEGNEGSSAFIAGNFFEAPFGSRDTTLELDPEQRAGESFLSLKGAEF
jgi:hypothetical protein